MAIYALGDNEPTIASSAYVHPDAVVIGSVTLAHGVSIWPQSVLRGDYGEISVGEMSNIQDGSIIHCTATEPTLIGKHCVIGHGVHIEGARIGDRALISSGSIVLNSATVGAGAVVAAGCLVPPRFVVPERAMALGIPARIRDNFEVDEAIMAGNTERYYNNSLRYRSELRRLD